MLKLSVPLAGILALAGCSLAPTYQRPAAPVAGAYPDSPDIVGAPNPAPAADLAWEEFFRDARLQRLIRLALENNRDLRVATLNVERVRAFYNIQRTALVPSLDATGDAVRQRMPADLSPSGRAATTSTFTAGLEIPSYEVDFFGRVASLREQVLQQYLATEEARLSAQISLISAVARQYLALIATDEQLALARQTLEAADRSYDLNRETYEAGVSSELDLRTAETQRAAVQASLAALEQQRARNENALVLLVGAPLSDDLPPAGSLATQALLRDIPAGLPADLLQRRPDIRAAEHTLQAANANIGVARAAFFPSITLTAFGGTGSAELSGLFEKGSGRWSFAPSITLPLFASGRNKAQLDVAWIEQRIEVSNYQKAIQTAFREVADALAVRRLIDSEIAAQETRVAAAQRRYDLTRERFEGGVDSFLAVLLAQQELYAAQQALIETRFSRLANLTTLYAALGGGWRDAAPASPRS